jgi:site-specific DNA recombinase
VLDLEAERRGCKWVALDDWGDDSHEGQLLKFIKGWMAKGERSKTAERMQRGKRQRAREGKIVPAGKSPLGYEYVDGAYRIDEANMVLVRRIFSLAAGGESLWRIKKTFESEGILTPGSTYKGPSRYWNVNTIRGIIKRDEYLAHGPEDIQGLVSAGQLTATVAATLKPNRNYGISWYNRYHTVGTANKRRKGEEKPQSEWIAVPVPDAGIPREHVEKARANLKGERAPRADNRFWELSGHIFCKCGVRLVARVTHKNRHSYPYYVCSRYVRDGCEYGKWMRADKLEPEVYWALRNIQPQDLKAQIQTLIDRERPPEAEIKAAHAVLEDVAQQRVKFQTMAARDLITLEELEVHLDGLDKRRRAAQGQIETLQNTSERMDKLRQMQRNPILTVMGQTEQMRQDYYDDLELRVEIDKGDVKICGVFGSQKVARTSMPGTKI